MKTINNIISSIMDNAEQEIGKELINRSYAINSAFDDAYGSCLAESYGTAMECLGVALKWLDQLIELGLSTYEHPRHEFIRDALGSVKLDKAPLEASIRKDLDRQISWIVNPGFGDDPRKILTCSTEGVWTESEGYYEFNTLKKNGKLKEATMYWHSAAFSYENGYWVFDCRINPASRPDLERYM
jgi:hypothetical protein